MKILMKIKILFLVSTFIVSLTAQADQSDSRLTDLFMQLKETEDVVLANNIANRIWEIWIEHEDSQASTLMLRGMQQMNANSLSAALTTFDQLIALKPDFAEAWNKRATIYYLQGRYVKSLRDIEEVLKLEPFHFGALSGRGLVYMSQENYFLARSAFLTLLEVYPAMPGVRDTVLQLEQVLRESVI